MKSWLTGPLLGILFLFSACNNQSADKQEPVAILDMEPYTGITDSISKDAQSPALYQRRAELLVQHGELELAYKDYLKIWELAPTEQNAEQLVNILFMTGKSEAALSLLKELLKKYPANEQFQRRLSEALMNTGEINQAIQSFDRMIAEDSANFEAWFEKGLLLLEQKDTTAAIQHLENSYRLQPLLLTALTLANIYSETKNPRTLVLADRIIAKDSAGEMADPYFIKGIYYVNTGNNAKALEFFNTCIRMNWKFQEAYIEKGIIYFDSKNLDEALQQFKLAATVTNTYPEAYYWQGRCYEELGMKEEALANYGRAYSLDRTFKEAVEAATRVERKNK